LCLVKIILEGGTKCRRVDSTRLTVSRSKDRALSSCLPSENSETQLSLNNKCQEVASRYSFTNSSLNVLAILKSTTETPTGYPRLDKKNS